MLCRVSPFGNLRINGHLHLPEAYRSLSRPSSAPDAKAFPLRSFALDLISCCQEGLALVLKRLNYAGSEFFEIVCVTLFEKFHKSFLFPSVACSSYLVTLFSFQGAFPASFETRSKHLNFKCLYPTSKFPIMKFPWPTFFFQKKVGGPKWTRTTDLTIISRAL